jgi:hypothetical protein
MSESKGTARDEKLRERVLSWNRATDGGAEIERRLSESGKVIHHYPDDGNVIEDRSSIDVPRPTVSDEELDAWRVGTTELSPADADRLWQWYNDVYETALVNGNRTRGVRAFLERGVLFPWRTATCGRHRYDSARSTLPLEWAEWAIDVGVTHADVRRDDLLVDRQGPVDVPRPATR